MALGVKVAKLVHFTLPGPVSAVVDLVVQMSSQSQLCQLCHMHRAYRGLNFFFQTHNVPYATSKQKTNHQIKVLAHKDK